MRGGGGGGGGIVQQAEAPSTYDCIILDGAAIVHSLSTDGTAIVHSLSTDGAAIVHSLSTVERLWTMAAPSSIMQSYVELQPAEIAQYIQTLCLVYKAHPSLTEVVGKIVSHGRRILSNHHPGFA